MAVHFTLDDKDVKKIETAISQSGVNAEQVINNYLRTRAPEKIIPSIVGLMPISERKKKHARASNPLTHQNFNLSVVVKTKNEYWYLQFPNDAKGTSERKTPKEFMEKGLEKVKDSMINDMLNELSNNIMK